jgi:hypothetical protein
MFKRRWVRWGLAMALVLLAALAFVAFRSPGHRITRADYDCIREGMTLPEVEDILGGPPGTTAGSRTRRPASGRLMPPALRSTGSILSAAKCGLRMI